METLNTILENSIHRSPEAAENAKRGEELSHFAELLFLRSSSEWHRGVFLEIITGVFMVLISELGFTHEQKLTLALIGFMFFGIAYYWRYLSEDTFDMADTMRRQAALSEGLGWPVNNHQFLEWKRRAGRTVIEKFKNTTRPENFYATKEQPGPRKLLQLTLESAFWTRHLYFKLRTLMWWFFFFIIALALGMMCLSLLKIIPEENELQLVSSVFLLLPAIMIFDVLEWILKLAKFIQSIQEVEMDMERLDEQTDISESQVLRLVSEFDCVVTGGFPIHPKLYARWHDDIQELWDERLA